MQQESVTNSAGARTQHTSSRVSRYAQYHGTRDQQLESLRAKGWKIATFKCAPVVVAWHSLAGKIHAKLWAGNAAKPAWYYTFRTYEHAMQHATKHAEGFAKQIELRESGRAAERAKRSSLKASDHYAIGDVLCNSWGYDQTNIDFYEVMEIKAKSIVIRPLASNTRETGFMCGPTQPIRGEYTGGMLPKPLDPDGGITFQFGCACKWNGKPQQCSWYA